MRHFLKETDFSLSEACGIFDIARGLKQDRCHHGEGGPACTKPLQGQSWGMLFSKSSTRTRVSFEVGIFELGGNAIFMPQNQLQIGRGETIADTAKVLSRYLHGLVIRCHEHAIVEEFAREGRIPIVNALTDFLHPCQIYSDIFTSAEHWAGSAKNVDWAALLKGKKIVYFGDCANNMAYSWILGGALFGMEVVLSGPKAFAPERTLIDAALREAGLPINYVFTEDASAAIRGANIVTTDVWVSMGQEQEEADRLKSFDGYTVNGSLFEKAHSNAVFLHCLPAHLGQEVAPEVFNHPRSLVFDEAENRLHIQKAILTQLVQHS
jgi:ornithine carbamoyltransferase